MQSPGSWMDEMLAQWLLWRPGDARGSTDFPTRDVIATAVSKAGLGVIAEEIRNMEA